MRLSPTRRRMALVGGLAAVAIGAMAAFAWAVAAGGGTTGDLLPNLTQAPPGALAGRTGGTLAEPRFFLGFESAAANTGKGPLVVAGRRGTTTVPEMALEQEISRSDGSTRAVAVRAQLRYVRSPDHSHWHLLGFMRYELHASDGGHVLTDRKTGFCLGDRYRAGQALPGRSPTMRFRDRCGKGAPRLLAIREGISVGWGDNYQPNLEGQEFEVTSLPAGRYVLVHRVNPARQLRESDYTDNTASMAVELSWPRGRRLPPTVDVVRRCPGKTTCP